VSSDKTLSGTTDADFDPVIRVLKLWTYLLTVQLCLSDFYSMSYRTVLTV